VAAAPQGEQADDATGAYAVVAVAQGEHGDAAGAQAGVGQ
jgi:hypothetical protein